MCFLLLSLHTYLNCVNVFCITYIYIWGTYLLLFFVKVRRRRMVSLTMFYLFFIRSHRSSVLFSLSTHPWLKSTLRFDDLNFFRSTKPITRHMMIQKSPTDGNNKGGNPVWLHAVIYRYKIIIYIVPRRRFIWPTKNKRKFSST